MAGQRVQPQPASAPSQRVVATPPPRVATMSNNTTAPNVIRQMPLVHQHHTCNNNPFHLLANDDNDDDTVVASNCSPHNPLPNLQPINLPAVLQARRPAIQLASQPTSVQPSTPSNTPPPRVLLLPKIIPIIAPRILHNHLHDLRPHQPRTNRKLPPVTKHQPHYLPVVEPDEEAPIRLPAPPRRSIHLVTSCTPCQISLQALFHLINIGSNKAPSNMIPQALQRHHKQYTGPIIKIEQYCNSVVHPVTKETITHYRELIKDPLLKDLWTKAMSKELHQLAQGCHGVTKGRNTIFFLSHADFCLIPKDRTVNYACIVIDHCPQKEDPNHAQITVGGYLINYPFELTTRTADMVSSKILWNSVISTPDARFACWSQHQKHVSPNLAGQI
jgi:hypothetical protein